MLIKRITSKEIYLSESTKDIIKQGLNSKDSLVKEPGHGFEFTLEPIFVKDEEILKSDKNKACELPFNFEEYLVFDFERKGPRKPCIVGNNVFINGTHQVFDFNGELVKTLVEFEPEHANGTFDTKSNLFYVISKHKIYVYNLALNLVYQISEFIFKKEALPVSFFETISLTKDYLICAYGSKYSKSFVVKYIGGVIDKQLALERGFALVASSANAGIVVTYHESKGVYNIYNHDLELINTISSQKKCDRHKISPNGKHLAFSSNSSNKLSVMEMDSLNLREFKVHPFGKAYPFKPKDIFRYTNNFWFTEDSNKIIVAGDKYLLNLIDLENQSSQLFAGHELVLDSFYNGVHDVKFNPESRLILIAASDYRLIIWNYNSEIEAKLVGHTGTVSSFEFSDNFEHLVSCSVDGTVRFWKRNVN